MRRIYIPRRIGRAISLLENGDPNMIDRLYRKTLYTLQKKIGRRNIFLKRNLRRYWRKPHYDLHGYLDGNQIYLCAGDSKVEKAKTVIHEILHYLYESAHEKQVRKLEDLVWHHLVPKQKKQIKKWVPVKLHHNPIA